MAAINLKGWEYAKFGDGWVRRERESDDEWEPVAEVPPEVEDEHNRIQDRHRAVSPVGGIQPPSQGNLTVNGS